jgi:hypothetical protein
MAVGINKMPDIISEKLYNFFGKRVAFTANPNMCWEWQGTKNEHGYGYFSIPNDGKNKKIKAHRLSYYIHYKVDPIGFLVRHKCDNPACCNPNHLELGTTQDNVDDMKNRGRMAVGEMYPRTKRTAAEVLEIRRLFENGMSRREIAEKFNIPRSSVISLILRREWKHI